MLKLPTAQPDADSCPKEGDICEYTLKYFKKKKTLVRHLAGMPTASTCSNRNKRYSTLPILTVVQAVADVLEGHLYTCSVS